MDCGCGGGAPRVPMTSADYAAVQEAQAEQGEAKFRLVRAGHDDEHFATYAAARQAASAVGGLVRTV